MESVRNSGERAIQLSVPVADRVRAVDIHRRSGGGGNGRQRNSLAVQLAANARESRLQYALAHTASDWDGLPHFRHFVGASADWNSSSGRQRIVAFVSSLI